MLKALKEQNMIISKDKILVHRGDLREFVKILDKFMVNQVKKYNKIIHKTVADYEAKRKGGWDLSVKDLGYTRSIKEVEDFEDPTYHRYLAVADIVLSASDINGVAADILKKEFPKLQRELGAALYRGDWGATVYDGTLRSGSSRNPTTRLEFRVEAVGYDFPLDPRKRAQMKRAQMNA